MKTNDGPTTASQWLQDGHEKPEGGPKKAQSGSKRALILGWIWGWFWWWFWRWICGADLAVDLAVDLEFCLESLCFANPRRDSLSNAVRIGR